MNLFRNALLTTSVGLALSLGAGQAQAFAFDLEDAGSLSIKFDFYSAECDSTTATCYGGNVGNPNLATGTSPGNGTYNETTFGVGRFTSIASEPGSFPTVWQQGDAGEQLLVFIYGVADEDILGPDVSGNYTILNTGCLGGDCDGKIHMDVYAVPTGQFFGFVQPNGLSTSDRTGFDTFAGITDIGELVYKSEFTQGARGINGADDMVQTTRAGTLPTTGSGAWLADCVAGPACVWFDSNSQDNSSDFFGQFTLQIAAAPLQANGWLGYNNDPILTNAIPEPGIFALLGGGLLGLGFAGRMRKGRS
jgi:hypothetical protein